MAKKNHARLHKKHRNEVNKKAIIWVCSIFAGIVIVMAVLLVLNI